MSKKRIAVIAGDGIGKEVMPEGVRVMDAAARKFGIDLQFDHFDFSSWDYCESTARCLPDDWKDQIGGHDAIFFGAVGWPDEDSRPRVAVGFAAAVPPRVRPVHQPAPGTPDARHHCTRGAPRRQRREARARSTCTSCARTPRASTPASAAACIPGTEREIVVQETVMSRIGVDRVLKFAFELARSRPKKHLTSATKSNGISHHHAVLGRARGRNGAGIPGCAPGQVPHRHPHRAFRAASRFLRCGGGQQPVRRHPERPGAGLHRHHRHRAQSPTSIRTASSRRCSSRCMGRRPTSPAGTSPIRSARSGAVP
jgi:hypothetical protein